ncbi:putative C-type lectin domain family 20 member A [Trichomycterus rosablanca]|uniref:putative C-type lectin domain family 20 member A n=1 Tax=Trichomycterus rosablanca TaxID=2290929 RepID=UPI002F3517B8
MEQHLFIFLFFTGFAPLIQSVPRKYYLIREGKTWSDAQTYCRATHTDLATIETSDEMIKLQNVAQTQSFTSDAWIGLYFDFNVDWRWSFANESLGTMTNWCSYNTAYTCVLATPTCWDIHPCECTHPFMCFDERFTGSARYIYNSTYMTWFDAQNYCRTFHTDLASARGATEDSFIRGKLTQAAWIGLYSGSWKWADQTVFNTIKWMPGQPSNLLIENCTSVLNGQALNYNCFFVKSSFCYRIITGQLQIIKLKVQSSEDVNNYATMAALLEKIKQKLIELGLQSNIKLKWRKQPNGLVFHKKID